MEFGPVAPPQGAERPRRRRARRALLLFLLLAGAATAWFAVTRRHSSGDGTTSGVPAADAVAARPERIIGDSLRITVEVVNATEVRGLARQATAWLRDAGFDVVNTTTAPERERRDSSLVLYGTGHPEWAALAARSLGGARIEARPDSLRYTDLTVLVGRSWRPPPQTLYP